MTDLDFRWSVVGESSILARLDSLDKRLDAIREEMLANEREYQELRDREEIVLAEHAELRSRFNSLREWPA